MALETKFTPSQTDEYLRRIRYSGPPAPTTQTLFALQRAHLLSVPFENLDISLGRPIRLEMDALFSKLVGQGRGGFCYELNGLFAGLLEALGYQVFLLNARGVEDDGSYGPEFDHLALQVLCPDDPTPWLVDVGWGNGPFEPLHLLETGLQRQAGRTFQLQRKGEYLLLAEQLADSKRWIQHYAFTQEPHALQDFSACCQYHQTSPDSIFTQKRICSIFLEDGHITLSDSPSGGCRLITTRRGAREERTIGGEAEFKQVLRNMFGVDLEIPVQ
jgi:N-hydroxyarylamine O-acetyltransferase